MVWSAVREGLLSIVFLLPKVCTRSHTSFSLFLFSRIVSKIVHTADCLKVRKLTACCVVSQNELTCYRQQFSMALFPSPLVHWQDWQSLLYQDITSGHILRHAPGLYGKYLPRDCHGNWWYCQLSVLCIPKSWLVRVLADSSMFM